MSIRSAPSRYSAGLKSSAPPLIALVGLLGMLGGDQLVSQLKDHLAARGEPPAVSTPSSPKAGAPGAAKGAKDLTSDNSKH